MATRRMAEQWYQQKKAIEEWWTQNFAAGSISRMWIKKYSFMRRAWLYTNVMRTRCAMSVYIRHMVLFTQIRSVSIVVDFLNSNVVGSTVDSSQPIHRFIWKVRIVQRKWRKLQCIRAARVEVYTNVMRTMEPEVVKLLPKKKDKKGHVPKHLPEIVMYTTVLDMVKRQQKQQLQAWEAYKKEQANESIAGFEASLNAVAAGKGEIGFALDAPRATAFYIKPQECKDILISAHENLRQGNFDKLIETNDQNPVRNGGASPGRTTRKAGTKIDTKDLSMEKEADPESQKEDGDIVVSTPEASGKKGSGSASKPSSSTKSRKSKKEKDSEASAP